MGTATIYDYFAAFVKVSIKTKGWIGTVKVGGKLARAKQKELDEILGNNAK